MMGLSIASLSVSRLRFGGGGLCRIRCDHSCFEVSISSSIGFGFGICSLRGGLSLGTAPSMLGLS